MIRLTRVGRTSKNQFRIVIAQKDRPVKGRFIEIIGSYDSQAKQEQVKVNEDRLKYWLSCGAVASETVNNLLVSKGILPKIKLIKRSSKKKVKEKEEKPEKPAVIESPTQPQTQEGSAMELASSEAEKTAAEETAAEPEDRPEAGQPMAEEPAEEKTEEPAATNEKPTKE